MKTWAGEGIEGETDNRLLVLAPEDNVAVLREAIPAGETLIVSGLEITVTAYLGAGHKLARCDIATGDKILKYGAPIGSTTRAIATGDHVHLHNIKSDYTQSHSLDAARKHHEPNKGGSDAF